MHSSSSTSASSTSCGLCGVVRNLSFSGERRPYEPWRRAALLLVCAALLVASLTLIWVLVARTDPTAVFLRVVCVAFTPLFALGIAAGARGCRDCVVRLYGEGP
jgi:hypothetical protein